MTTIFRNRFSKPVTIEEDPDALPPPPDPRKSDRAKQLALYAFLGVFVAVMLSSVGYMISRRSSPTAKPQPQVVATQQQIPAPAPAPAPSPQPQQQPPVATPPQPVATAQKPPQQPATTQPAPAPRPSQQPAPVPVSTPPPAASVAQTAAPAPAAPAMAMPGLQMEKPQANRTYLQIGSIEKGVAEVLTQGLRIRGLRATVAPGVTPRVYRIIVGPFESTQEEKNVERILSGLGLQSFPRQFSPEELRKLNEEAAALSSAPATPPDVRR